MRQHRRRHGPAPSKGCASAGQKFAGSGGKAICSANKRAISRPLNRNGAVSGEVLHVFVEKDEKIAIAEKPSSAEAYAALDPPAAHLRRLGRRQLRRGPAHRLHVQPKPTVPSRIWSRSSIQPAEARFEFETQKCPKIKPCPEYERLGRRAIGEPSRRP